jgi:hypothetical protein
VPGTPFNGISSNVAIPAALTIQSSTAANPTVIQTTGAHGLRSGDIVDITDHYPNTAANSVDQTVTVVDSTHFSVPIDSHTYSAGGTHGFVWPRSFTGNVSLLPANSDPYSAATYIPAAACEADRTAFLLWQQQPYRLMAGNFNLSVLSTDVNFTTPWAYVPHNTSATAGSPKPITTTSGGSTPYGSIITSGAIPVNNSDFVEVSVSLTANWFGAVTGSQSPEQEMYFYLYCAYYVPGHTVVQADFVAVGGSPKAYSMGIMTLAGPTYQQSVYNQGVDLKAVFNVFGQIGAPIGHGANDSCGMLDLQIYAAQLHGNTNDTAVQLWGGAVSSVKVLRPNQIKVAT